MSVTLITGPPGSGKTERLLGGYRQLLGERPPGAGLWLVPNWRAGTALRQRLLEGPSSERLNGCFAPGVMTFETFADSVLESSPTAVRPLRPLMKRRLIGDLIKKQLAVGRLEYFGPIASTTGLVDLVCEFISELKRLEIWPDAFRGACDARGSRRRDGELIQLYESYQQSLTDHHLYDAEGRLWSARDQLVKEQPLWLRNLRHVVIDGFTDFTRTQHEIIGVLADRAEQVTITLPLESAPLREDLFTKPLKTKAELQNRHGDLAVEELPRRQSTTWPAMAHLERQLFVNPRKAQTADDTDRVEIIAAARQLGEIEQIAARVKRLLTEEHVPPSDIAVVLRSPAEVDSLLREVFADLGIPAAIEQGRTLDRSPAVRALMNLLQLDIEDWPAMKLLAVVGGNYFQPDWPEYRQGTAVVALERAIGKRQLTGGRKRLLQRLGGQPDEDRPEEDSEETTCHGGPLLRRLAEAFDRLPRKATMAEWAAAWEELARDTGLLTVVERHNGEETAEPLGGALADSTAWNRLWDSLRLGDLLWPWMGEQAPVLDRREAISALADVVAAEQVGSAGDESGRVRVLSATSVRGLKIPYMFLAGLSEKAFPPPQREDRLYSDADYRQLIQQGLPLVDHGERSREEMLLFYEVMTCASRRLYLSYPSFDESAQPLCPSPYLEEVVRACGEGRIKRSETADLSPVPLGDDPLSLREFRVKALATAVDGNVALLAGLLRYAPEDTDSAAESILAGLLLTHQRSQREGFGPTEGIFESQAARDWFAEQYSLKKTFAATSLESYAACPYRFLAERVMKLHQMEDLTLALDYRERGSLAHDVLATFHRNVNQNAGRPVSPLEMDEEEFDRFLSEAFEQSLGPRGEGLRASLREIDRRTLLKWAADYRKQHAEYDGQWADFQEPMAPEMFEVSFGRLGKDDVPPSTERPLELPVGDRVVRLAGRIDRIDTGTVAGQTVFNVLDYKTGSSVSFKQDKVSAGTALQLPLYALAVADLLMPERDPLAWQAAYWYLSKGGFKSKQAMAMHEFDGERIRPDASWEETRELLASAIVSLVDGIRRAEFPVYNEDEKCTSFCPFSTICRINNIRSLEKTWGRHE